jgi:hypothetical protein
MPLIFDYASKVWDINGFLATLVASRKSTNVGLSAYALFLEID